MEFRSPITLKWTQAKVGCHWSSNLGEFAISTFRSSEDSGYVLYRARTEYNRYDTLKHAQQAAEQSWQLRQWGVK